MLRNIKHFFILLLLALVITQFIRPEKNDASYINITDFEELASVTPEIHTILEKQCYDCHSYVTRYPWYMEVSPISHWMAYHIKEGKEHFNVSEWGSYTDRQKEHKLEEFIEEIEKKEMPLESYTWMHGKLSEADAQKLIGWANDLRVKSSEKLTPKIKDTIQQQIDSTAVDSGVSN